MIRRDTFETPGRGAASLVTDFDRETLPDDLDVLGKLGTWQVREGDVDPRGFRLLGRGATGAEEIGTIEDLVVSPSRRKAYFAILKTEWSGERRFMIPMLGLELDNDRREAVGPFLREQFEGAPEWRSREIEWQPSYSYWRPYAVRKG